MDNMHQRNLTRQGATNNPNARQGGREGSPVGGNRLRAQQIPEVLEQPQVQPLDKNVNIPMSIIIENILPRIENTNHVRALAKALLPGLQSDINAMRNHFYKQKVLRASFAEFLILLNNPEIPDDVIAHGVNNNHPNDSLRIKIALARSTRPLSEEHITALISRDHVDIDTALINNDRPLSPDHITALINRVYPTVPLALINSDRELSPDIAN